MGNLFLKTSLIVSLSKTSLCLSLWKKSGRDEVQTARLGRWTVDGGRGDLERSLRLVTIATMRFRATMETREESVRKGPI